MDPPGVSSLTFLEPLNSERTFVLIGSWWAWFSSFTVLPGLISSSSPTFSVPCFREPPRTAPLSFFGRVPGLLMSNERAIRKIGSLSGDLSGFGTSAIALQTSLMFTSCCAEIGIISACG